MGIYEQEAFKLDSDMSREIDQLATALAKAQAVMEPASKSATNPAFKSKYAELSAIIDACRGPLSAHGIAFVQLPYRTGTTVGVVTRLLHTSGQWVQCDVSIEVAQPNGHQMGSAVTYCRRQGLQSVVGIAAEVDDDGNTASTGKPAPDRSAFGPVPTKAEPPKDPQTPALALMPPELTGEAAVEAVFPGAEKLISEPQRKRLFAAAKIGGHSHDQIREYLAREYGIESSTMVPVRLFDAIGKRLQSTEPLL